MLFQFFLCLSGMNCVTLAISAFYKYPWAPPHSAFQGTKQAVKGLKINRASEKKRTKRGVRDADPRPRSYRRGDMAAAADGVFRCVLEGCLSGYDNGVERRPYHRNCGCALHNQSRDKSSTNRSPICGCVSYPIRRSWSEGSLVMAAFSAHSSPSSSPAVGVRPQMSFVDLVGEEQNHKGLLID